MHLFRNLLVPHRPAAAATIIIIMRKRACCRDWLLSLTVQQFVGATYLSFWCRCGLWLSALLFLFFAAAAAGQDNYCNNSWLMQCNHTSHMSTTITIASPSSPLLTHNESLLRPNEGQHSALFITSIQNFWPSSILKDCISFCASLTISALQKYANSESGHWNPSIEKLVQWTEKSQFHPCLYSIEISARLFRSSSYWSLWRRALSAI